MNEQEITQLITRMLADEASADEKLRLEQWRYQHADHEAQFQQMKLIWEHAALFKDDVDTDAAWEKFSARIRSARKKPRLTYYLQVAAAVIFIGGAALFAATLLWGPSTRSVQTASGEAKEIVLPDGSVAWLNHDSKLEYDKDFKGKVRAIRLNGEAFFDVVKNPGQPFVITSAHSVTTVLGTSFNLTAYDSLGDVNLTVVSGKVSFVSTQTQNEVIVTANESATITPNEDVMKNEHTDVNAIAWKTKKLSFNDAPLSEVFKSLEHYFNVKITIDNPGISNCHFTGEFINPSFKEVIDVIAKTLQLSYEQKAKKVTVSGKGCE